MRILLVIPTYNCQEQIGRLFQKSIPAINREFDELLVIDNGSTDQTVENVITNMKNIGIRTKVLQNCQNISLGGSLKTGFLYAKDNSFDFVAVLHGDDQALLDDLLPVIEELKKENIDLAIGARFHPGSTLVGYSNFRKLGNRLLNLYGILCTQKKIDDLIAGLNVFRVSKLDLNQILNYPNNLTFDVHVLLRAIHLKQNIKFFPITWTEEDQVSNAKVIRQGLTILRLFTKYLVLREKALNFQATNDTYQSFMVVFEREPKSD
jgi:glycosyltransferase involved in cell wall biosynthesis